MMFTRYVKKTTPKCKKLIASLILVFVSSLNLGFVRGLQIDWGPPAQVGEGEIRTFVIKSRSGEPRKVGVYFTEGMLSGLPAEMFETVLQFPGSIEVTSLDHFALDWAPQGHAPEGVYSRPHFDFHFYMISEQERAEIEAGRCTTEEDARIPDPPGEVQVTCEVFAKGMQPLPEDMHPPDYVITPDVVPLMGNHLGDPTSPEFNGQPFTYTWIYGAYEGELTFLEPMITAEFLAEQESACEWIKTPEAMPEAGWYPTRYCIRYHSHQGAYTLTLEAFRWFEASDGA